MFSKGPAMLAVCVCMDECVHVCMPACVCVHACVCMRACLPVCVRVRILQLLEMRKQDILELKKLGF